jgi:hypothetical protein
LIAIGISVGAAKQVVNPLLENWVNSRTTGESAARSGCHRQWPLNGRWPYFVKSGRID